MIVKKFDIDVYEWSVAVVITSKDDSQKKLRKILNRYSVPKSILRDTIIEVNEGDAAGLHLYIRNGRSSLVIIHNAESFKSMATILSHELRHVADRILSHMDIKDDEAAAYLQGTLARKTFPLIFKLK